MEAKQVQRSQVPVLVGDLRSAQQAVGAAQGALSAHQMVLREKPKPTKADQKKTDLLTDRLRDAVNAAAATVELVEVQSMPAQEYEALISSCLNDDGDTDLFRLLPSLLAASCVEEELRDEDKWAEQLARPVWTEGELIHLRAELMGLNMHVPSGGQGKG